LLAVIERQRAEGRLTQPQCLFEYRLEHRRKVAGRGIDDLQDLGGRGLLIERLITFRGALFQLSLGIVTLGCALSKPTLQIGYELLGIG
jgi:hypothetical protein